MTVLILDQDDSLTDLDTALADQGVSLQVVRLGAEQLARRTGIAPEVLRTHRDALPLQLLASATSIINLAPRTVTSGYNRMRASRGIYATAAIAVTAAMLWMGINLVRTTALEEEAQQFTLLARGEDARYNEISRTFPATPASSAQLREIAEFAARVRGAYRPPDTVFQVLGQALDQTPAVQVKTVSWRQTLQGDARAALSQSVAVSAELLAYDVDPRVVIGQIDEFVRRVGQHPAVATARATRYPVSSASTAALTGDTSVTRTDQPVTPAFELEVQLKPGA